jgi:hypothetical protein
MIRVDIDELEHVRMRRDVFPRLAQPKPPSIVGRHEFHADDRRVPARDRPKLTHLPRAEHPVSRIEPRHHTPSLPLSPSREIDELLTATNRCHHGAIDRSHAPKRQSPSCRSATNLRSATRRRGDGCGLLSVAGHVGDAAARRRYSDGLRNPGYVIRARGLPAAGAER